MNHADLGHLRAAIQVAQSAREHGNHPFGAILVDESDRVLLEAENTVMTGHDCTGHAETNLMRLATQHFPPERLALCTLYTSTEPCAMCAGAIHWGNVRRVVYALSEIGLYEIIGPSSEHLLLSCQEIFAHSQRHVEVVGPADELAEEARKVHEGFWQMLQRDQATKILETERLILRHLSDDDAEFMLELLNDPAFIQNIGDRKIRSLDGARAYIQNGPVASYAKHGFGLYLVQLRETGESIGMCGLIRRDQLDDVDIGYAFLPKFWSKGYATKSARAVKQFARNVIGLKRVVAITDPQNAGSIRVLEKLGMKFEKMVRLAADDIELKIFSIDL